MQLTEAERTPETNKDTAARSQHGQAENDRGKAHDEQHHRRYQLGADSANVYSRVKGTAQMKLWAAKRKRFPMTDDSPPANSDQPEEREYQAILVMDDEEIGGPSDIVSAVWRPF